MFSLLMWYILPIVPTVLTMMWVTRSILHRNTAIHFVKVMDIRYNYTYRKENYDTTFESTVNYAFTSVLKLGKCKLNTDLFTLRH